jgi:flagellar hook-associated protein 2
MAISSPGIGSGLDVNNIVTQLMNVEKQPLTLLDQKEASFQSQLSAYGTLRGALANFQTAVSGLNNLSNFQTVSATSSDTGIVSATATTGAQAGVHDLDVTQLAQAHAIAAAGQISTSAAIGSGTSTTLTFDFGTISGGVLASGVYTGATFTQDGAQTSGTVTIDSSNNSLQGIRDAINAAKIGVRASIINDGSGTPYRLTLTSTTTGAAHSVRIGVSGDAALASLLGYDPAGTQNLTQTQAAQDAKLTVDGVNVSSASNSVTGALDGVTLKLSDKGASQVTIARDTSGAKAAIQAFVKAYNDFDKTIDDLTKFDTSGNGNSGALLGDSAARTIQSRLRDALASSLPSTGTGSLQFLAQTGIAFQKDGTLSIDNAKLSAALSANPDTVAALFTSFGQANDSLVKFNKAGESSQAGSYNITVSALATQATLVGSGAAATTITAGVNDQLSINVNGASALVTLPAGSYTAASLAAQLQSTINGATELISAGASISVTQSAGVLTITSARYGSSSTVGIGGNAAVGLFGAAPVSTDGVDVAGTIGGVAALGSGQTLTGGPGSGASGLAVDITGGALGARGSVSFGRGFAAKLSGVLNDILSSTGLLAASTDGVNRSIKDIDEQRAKLNTRLTSVEARYRAQFNQLDTLLSSMQSTSAFLTQQLAVLNGTSVTARK